jgi:hypothetical protein
MNVKYEQHELCAMGSVETGKGSRKARWEMRDKHQLWDRAHGQGEGGTHSTGVEMMRGTAETVIEGMEWLGQWIQRRMVQWHLNLMWRGQYQWEVHCPVGG